VFDRDERMNAKRKEDVDEIQARVRKPKRVRDKRKEKEFHQGIARVEFGE
jgi:hypothetical protein